MNPQPPIIASVAVTLYSVYVALSYSLSFVTATLNHKLLSFSELLYNRLFISFCQAACGSRPKSSVLQLNPCESLFGERMDLSPTNSLVLFKCKYRTCSMILDIIRFTINKFNLSISISDFLLLKEIFHKSITLHVTWYHVKVRAFSNTFYNWSVFMLLCMNIIMTSLGAIGLCWIHVYHQTSNTGMAAAQRAFYSAVIIE
jgi:hypothetical protein